MTAGRPTEYTKELANTICNRIADGNSLRSVCLAEDMPSIDYLFLIGWSTNKEFVDHIYASV